MAVAAPLPTWAPCAAGCASARSAGRGARHGRRCCVYAETTSAYLGVQVDEGVERLAQHERDRRLVERALAHVHQVAERAALERGAGARERRSGRRGRGGEGGQGSRFSRGRSRAAREVARQRHDTRRGARACLADLATRGSIGWRLCLVVPGGDPSAARLITRSSPRGTPSRSRPTRRRRQSRRTR